MYYDDSMIVEERNGYRVRLEYDDSPEEPYCEFASPLLRYDGGRTEHVAGTGGLCAGEIEHAAREHGAPYDRDFRIFEKYLRAYHGVTQVETWHSGNYWYITYDDASWRAAAGTEPGSASMDYYQAWCTGDVYGWIIERENPDSGEWEDVDSCWGYYGWEWAKESALEAFADYGKSAD